MNNNSSTNNNNSTNTNNNINKDKDIRSSTGTEYKLSTNSNSGSRRSSLAGTGNDIYLNGGEANNNNHNTFSNGRLSVGGNDQDNNTFNTLYRYLGPQISDLHDSVITLDSNMDRLNTIHNNLVDLNESFGSFLYGLICSSSCLQFPGLPNNIQEQMKVIERLNQLETEKKTLLRQIKETKSSMMKSSTLTSNNNNSISDDDDDMDDQDIDLHKLVNVKDVLTPISCLSDIVNKPSTLRIFQNKIMYDLSLKIILMIEREQSFVNRYSNILDIFLGDYPNPLYESILRLKDYDHNLILPDKEEDDEEEKEKEKMETEKMMIEKQKDARGHGSSNTVEDPFFALPEISNKDGLKLLIGNNSDLNSLNNINNINEQLELTRQMTQIALQRNEEFIRNLLKIRNFLDKSNRIRERILSWSKESVGIQDDDVTVPSVLRVVKRGLISATTNQTVKETDINVDENNSNENEHSNHNHNNNHNNDKKEDNKRDR